MSTIQNCSVIDSESMLFQHNLLKTEKKNSVFFSLLTVFFISSVSFFNNPFHSGMPGQNPIKPEGFGNDGNNFLAATAAVSADNEKSGSTKNLTDGLDDLGNKITNDAIAEESTEQITDGLENLEKNRKRGANALKWKNIPNPLTRELRRWNMVENEYKIVKIYYEYDDVFSAMALEKVQDDLKLAKRWYEKALHAKNMMLKGSSEINGNEITQALNAISSIRQKIQKEFDKYEQNKSIMSTSEIRKRNTTALTYTLTRASRGYEYIVDSYGFSRDRRGNYSILAVNGYWRYDPANITGNTEQYLKSLGFSEAKKYGDNLVIYVVTDDNFNGKKYYGNQNNFDMNKLLLDCGLYNDYGQIKGYYMSVKLSGSDSYNILCQRVGNDIALEKDMYTITMDIRPKSWTKWTFTNYNVSEYAVKRIFNYKGLVETKLEHNKLIPHSVQQTSRNELWVNHVNFEKAVRTGMAKNYGIDDKEAGKRPKRIIELFCKNLSAEECCNLARNIENHIENQKKSYSSYSSSREINYQRMYEQACYYYDVAAGKGNEIALMNCAILLGNRTFIWYSTSGTEINYSMSAFIFNHLLSSSKNKKILKRCNSALSYLYSQGGYGLKKDYNLSKQYKEAANKIR